MTVHQFLVAKIYMLIHLIVTDTNYDHLGIKLSLNFTCRDFLLLQMDNNK